MSSLHTDRPFDARPGIRTRNDRQRNGSEPQHLPAVKTIVPIDDEVEEAALRFSTLAGNIKKDRDAMREERDTYRARFEQSESANTDLRSQLESQRALTDAATEQAQFARAEQVRLETVIASMVNMGTDALPR